MNPPPVINALPCVKAFVIRIFGLHVFLTNLKEDGPSATPPVRPQPQRLSRMDNDDYNGAIQSFRRALSTNTTLWGPTTLDALAGKHSNGSTVSKSFTLLTDIRMEI